MTAPVSNPALSGENDRQILVWHDPQQETADMAAWIAERCAGAPVLTDLHQAGALLADSPDTRLVVVIDPPRTALARTLGNGHPPEQALAQWRKDAIALLSLVRHNRRRVRLVDQELALANPNGLTHLLELPECPDDDSPSQPESMPDPMLLLLAEQCLRENGEADALAHELSASAPDLSNGAFDPSINTSAAFAAFHLRQKESDDARLVAARQTAQMEDAFERNLEELSDRQNRLQTVEADLADVESELAQVESELAAQKGKLETLEEKHIQVVKERDAAVEKAASLETDADRLQVSLDLQTKQSQAMADEMGALQLQNGQLVQRLEQVNEGIESFQAQNSNLQEQLDDRDTQISHKDQQVHAMALRIQQLLNDIDAGNGARAGLQAELDRIMNSRSMRATEPLRRLANMLRRVRGDRV